MTNPYFQHILWPVFYEDNHLLVLYKPAGLLVQGDNTGDMSLLELAKDWLKKRYNKPGQVFLGLVHRLDRPVAGVILFARTSKAAGRLSEQFRSGRVQKRYFAVVEGKVEESLGSLTHHIERRGQRSTVVAEPTLHSREARLGYRLIETSRERSLVEIELKTGRRHQIRLQLAHSGHPIVGDLRYGASGPLPQKQIALLARELTIAHPVRREWITFRSPFPKGWPWSGLPIDGESPPWDWKELVKDLRRFR